MAAFEFRNDTLVFRRRLRPAQERRRSLCLSEREDNAPPPLVETAPWGYVRLRLENYSDADLENARGLREPRGGKPTSTSYEPTAPAYAQTLMKYAAWGTTSRPLPCPGRDGRRQGGFLLQYMGYLPGFLGVNTILRGSVARSCWISVPPSGAWITRSCGTMPASRLAGSRPTCRPHDDAARLEEVVARQHGDALRRPGGLHHPRCSCGRLSARRRSGRRERPGATPVSKFSSFRT